jgi:hypothetical protein
MDMYHKNRECHFSVIDKILESQAKEREELTGRPQVVGK